jgi:hypothetical protein
MFKWPELGKRTILPVHFKFVGAWNHVEIAKLNRLGFRYLYKLELDNALLSFYNFQQQ